MPFQVMSLVQRSVRSAGWNVLANLIKVMALFVRSLLLARWLPVEVFGIYTLASALVKLSVVIPNFGMAGAFLHQAPETEDEEHAAAVHFTLKLLFTLTWATVLIIGAWMYTDGQVRTALITLTAATGGIALTQTPHLILTRRVTHKRLAILQILMALLTTPVALGMAWRGATLWALLAIDVVILAITVGGLYLWRPVWRPRLAWSPTVVRYFLRFGSRQFLAVALMRALDRVDDLWTGLFLGAFPLGFYSRAYTFASYPRQVLADPINAVAGGTYAQLKGQQQRLSQAFFYTNALLVRTGFLLAGALALVAPEFIRLGLGSRWLPMLTPFRLMLVFALLDPIKVTVAHLFVAVGRPEEVVRARLVQLVVLIVALFLLGLPWGLNGVALAVDAMLVTGIGLLLWRAREHVDVSLRGLFLTPTLALMAGLALTLGVMAVPGVPGSDWRTGAVKLVVFTLAYLGVLIALEREQGWALLRTVVLSQQRSELDGAA